MDLIELPTVAENIQNLLLKKLRKLTVLCSIKTTSGMIYPATQKIVLFAREFMRSTLRKT